jgi:L-lysine exporter family protein LysE/ArgO
MIHVVIAGLLMGLSLIVAIGPQNAWVITAGLQRQRVGLVIAICIAGDLSLIVAGVGGVGSILSRFSLLLTLARYGGAAYLSYMALSRLRDARRPHALQVGSRASAGSVTRKTLTLTFLNPHVYLDTVVLLGSVSAHWGSERWSFAIGASLASVGWFTVVGFGARQFSFLATTPVVWRCIDLANGLIMLAVAASLILGA